MSRVRWGIDEGELQELILNTVHEQFTKNDEAIQSLMKEFDNVRIFVEQDHNDLGDRLDSICGQIEQKADTTALEEKVDASDFRSMEAILEGKVDTSDVGERLDEIDSELQRKAEIATFDARLEVIEARFSTIENRIQQECADLRERLDSVNQRLQQKADIIAVESQLQSLQQIVQRKADASDVSDRLDSLDWVVQRKADTADIHEQFKNVNARLKKKADASETTERLDSIEQRLQLKAEDAYMEMQLDKMQKSVNQKADVVEMGERLGNVEQRVHHKADVAFVDKHFVEVQQSIQRKIDAMHEKFDDSEQQLRMQLESACGSMHNQLQRKANFADVSARLENKVDTKDVKNGFDCLDQRLQMKMNAVVANLNNLEQQMQQKADSTNMKAHFAALEQCLAQKAELSAFNSIVQAVNTRAVSPDRVPYVEQVETTRKRLVNVVNRLNKNPQGDFPLCDKEDEPQIVMLSSRGGAREGQSQATGTVGLPMQDIVPPLEQVACGKSQSSRDARLGRPSLFEQQHETDSIAIATDGNGKGEHIASPAECVSELTEEEEEKLFDTVTPPQKQRRGRHYVSSPSVISRSLSHDNHLSVSQSDNCTPLKTEARVWGTKATTAKGSQSQLAAKGRVWRITNGGA